MAVGLDDQNTADFLRPIAFQFLDELAQADFARRLREIFGGRLNFEFLRGVGEEVRADYRMASGIANSLPEALQQATTNLSQWLAADYKLTPNEIALVLGTAILYDVAEVVDPLVHVVARIDKKALASLGPNQK